MSNFTQLRTGKGPFGSWLYRIRQRELVQCMHCRTEDETGDHIVFACQRLDRFELRLRHIPDAEDWEDLDNPIHLKRVHGRPGADDEEEPPD